MFADSQVVRYGLTLLAIFGGTLRLHTWFGPAVWHDVMSYSLDLCALTHQVICF